MSTDIWDFFIAHAGADLEPAKRLYDLLSPTYRVFLDSECLILGDSWTDKIPEAQRQSRVSLILISANTPDAWYQVDEIVHAVELTRQEGTEGHRVVPIYLDGKPQASGRIPPGLWQLHACDAQAEGGLDAVAGRLKTLMDTIGTVDLPNSKPKNAAPGSTQDLVAVRDVLAKLLQSLFTEPELRRFLDDEPEAPNLQPVLRSEADRQTLAFSAVDALLRDGRIDDAFFERLRERRGYRKRDIVAARGKWREARGSSVDALTVAQSPRPSEPTPVRTAVAEGSAWTARHILGAALKLDRSPQWSRVLESCQGEENAIFLLHGHSRQGIGLFLDRLQYYLTEESRQPHRVFRVPFRLEHGFALSGAEWESHIAHALAPGQDGTAADHLARAALHQGVLLILGKRPLHDLRADQRDGLREFLCHSLPEILHRAHPASPVRFFLAIDYDDEDDPLPDDVDRWALEAERPGALDYIALQEVGFPTWDEVRAYLRNVRPRPDERTTEKIRIDFDKIVNSEDGTFQRLAERLDRRLGDV